MRFFPSLKSAAVWVPLASLLLVWGLLYLPHLRDSPGWYGDETVSLQMGRELLRGRIAYGPLWLTYWHVFYPYQPGYLLLSGVFSAATGGDILGARFFNTLLALATALAICSIGRSRFGILAAWFGALVFLTYDQVLIHFRWVYCYNAVALAFSFAVLYLLRPSRPGDDWRAGGALAVGAMAHPLFLHGCIAACLCRLKRPPAWFRLGIPSAAVIGATFLFVTWTYWPKIWLLDDLASLAREYRASSTHSGGSLWKNVGHFYTQDLFHLGGLACALLCARKRYYVITVFVLVVSVLLLQNRENLTVFYYQAIILTPLLAMAWAAGLALLGKHVRRTTYGRWGERLCLGLAFSLPLFCFASLLPTALQGKLLPRNQPLVTQSVPEVERAASWLNDRSTPDDLVIANPNLSWLLRAKTADLAQATVWEGFDTTFLGHSFRRERFRYPADIETARFVAIGDIDQRWLLAQRNVGRLASRMIEEKWPVVWRGMYYTILANPRFVKQEE
jgi:hypothetical protein